MAIEPFCQRLFQPAILHMASGRMLKIAKHEDLAQLEKDITDEQAFVPVHLQRFPLLERQCHRLMGE